MSLLFALVASAVLCLQALAATPPTLTPTRSTPDPQPILDSGELILRDEARDKDMHIRVRAPKDAQGPFPLVVFSHGMGGSSDAFRDLSADLASHGYVVVHPTHSDSIDLRRRQGATPAELRTALTRDGVRNVDLPDRIADCIWVLDNLNAIEHALARPNLIDRTRAALAGHSAGAMTTQALAGLRFFSRLNSRGRTLADEPRFLAFVVISGQGLKPPARTEESWKGITRPMLVFAGSEDVSRVSDETPQSRRHPYELSPGGEHGPKYLVFIQGATHSSYQGSRNAAILREVPPANVEAIVELVNIATRRFLDAHVKGDPDAKAWLKDGPSTFPGVDVEYLSK